MKNTNTVPSHEMYILSVISHNISDTVMSNNMLFGTGSQILQLNRTRIWNTMFRITVFVSSCGPEGCSNKNTVSVHFIMVSHLKFAIIFMINIGI